MLPVSYREPPPLIGETLDYDFTLERQVLEDMEAQQQADMLGVCCVLPFFSMRFSWLLGHARRPVAWRISHIGCVFLLYSYNLWDNWEFLNRLCYGALAFSIRH